MSNHSKAGILITNLGTPSAPTASAVRTYLGEFLHDKRVVDLTRWLWCPILHGIILRFRPKKVAHAYASIWTEQGSPLMVTTQQQAAALQEKLGDNCLVKYAMRYGTPNIEQAVAEFAQADINELTVLPLYPQYAGATTESTWDALNQALNKIPLHIPIRHINDYHQHPAYIAATAQSIQDYWQQHGQADKLVFSYHGLPQRYVDNGDPYFDQCHASTRLIVEALGLTDTQWQLCFQSRFGREPWLQPYTDIYLEEFAKQGGQHVQVVCPGFSADCLETLEEIAMQNKALFLESGGQTLSYIPALNIRPDHIDMMAQLVSQAFDK